MTGCDLSEPLCFVIEEIFRGHARDAVFLDDGAPAIFSMLDALSAEEASRPVAGYCVAAHARHVLFSLGAYREALITGDARLLADHWPDWETFTVSPDDWGALRARLKAKAGELLRTIADNRFTEKTTLLFSMGALAHMAFHLGVIQVKYDALLGEGADAPRRPPAPQS